jgi:hypothetical protein
MNTHNINLVRNLNYNEISPRDLVQMINENPSGIYGSPWCKYTLESEYPYINELLNKLPNGIDNIRWDMGNCSSNPMIDMERIRLLKEPLTFNGSRFDIYRLSLNPNLTVRLVRMFKNGIYDQFWPLDNLRKNITFQMKEGKLLVEEINQFYNEISSSYHNQNAGYFTSWFSYSKPIELLNLPNSPTSFYTVSHYKNKIKKEIANMKVKGNRSVLF